MRYFLLFLLIIIYSLTGFCQNSQVKVTLKTGVAITGNLKELVPKDYVKIDVSGIETDISMNDVLSIEPINGVSNKISKSDSSDGIFLDWASGNYIITDNDEYPETIKFEIGGKEMEMQLVRGGTFIMGYDGRYSLLIDSEPLHKVHLSSFYISKNCITTKQVANLTSLNNNPSIEIADTRYHANDWKLADKVVKAIAKSTGRPFRLCTEAEWEYCSLMDFADKLYGSDKYYEWCSDFFGDYSSSEQINPQGPPTGIGHVERSYNAGRNKWARSFNHKGFDYNYLVRIAISADKVK